MGKKSNIRVKKTDGKWYAVEKKSKAEQVKVYKTSGRHAFAISMSEEERKRLEERTKILENKGSKIVCHKNGKWVVKNRRSGGTHGGGGTAGVKPDEYKGTESE